MSALANHFSHRNTVKDLTDWQHFLPHSSSFHQETPMKPSQVPNLPLHPAPNRALWDSSSEMRSKYKQSPQCTTPRSPGSFRSSPLVARPSCNVGSSGSKPHPMPNDKPAPLKDGNLSNLQPFLPRGRNHLSSLPILPHPILIGKERSRQSPVQSPPVELSPINATSLSKSRPSSSSSLQYPATPHHRGNSKTFSPLTHTRRDLMPKSKPTLSRSGNKNHLTEQQKPNQNHQLLTENSTQMQTPVVVLDRISPKRLSNSPSSHENRKKLRLEDSNSDETQKSPKTSLVHDQSFKRASFSEGSPKARGETAQMDGNEPSRWPERQSLFIADQSHDTPQLPLHCTRTPSAMGVKQAFLSSTGKTRIRLQSPAYILASKKSLKKRSEVNDQKDKSGSPHLPRKDNNCSSHAKLDVGHSSASAWTCSVDGDQIVERRKSNSSSSKSSHARKSAVRSENTEELFTPDSISVVVRPPQKIAKEREKHKSSSSKKDCSSRSRSASESSSHKSQNCTESSRVSSSIWRESIPPSHTKLKKSHSASPDVQLKGKKDKFDINHSSPPPSSVTPSMEQDAANSQHAATSSESEPPLKQRDIGKNRKQEKEEPVGLDLDLDDFSFPLDFEVTQSSEEEEEDQLVTLQEMMKHASTSSVTPEKGAFSGLSTPGNHSSPVKPLLPASMTSNTYKNSLDQMLKDINSMKRAQEIEMQLLNECKEDRLRIAEYEEVKEADGAVNCEQQEFLKRFSLMTSVFEEVPQGEEVFNLDRFGQIFDQESLQIRNCSVTPQGAAQKTLLWSTPTQLRLHVTIGLFQAVYDDTPCPSEVTLFLLKMMSIHRDRLVSDGLLHALCDIARTAACQRVNNGCQDFKVWVPSLADVTLILMNMGAGFVTLYPLENLQPLFTERDLLKYAFIKSESPSVKDQTPFPQHNCNNILKYLSRCLALCPRAYSDDELLLLLTVVCRIGLDPRLIFQSSGSPSLLLYGIIKNFKDWNTALPRIWKVLADITDDHHNMCYLIHLLPLSEHGKQLRQHLSLAMISKLLDGQCTYRPKQNDFQLSKLSAYLPRMRPSSLLQSLRNSDGTQDDECVLDQKAYDLCYSLLTLLNEATNMQFFSTRQKEQLLHLSTELETHVKCDIRENRKSLYRTKVKDLVARIDTKWQMLLQKTKPLNGKLYNYYQPVPTLSPEEEQDDEELTVMEDETTLTE